MFLKTRVRYILFSHDVEQKILSFVRNRISYVNVLFFVFFIDKQHSHSIGQNDNEFIFKGKNVDDQIN